jgi:7,8-dihydropterin-6-yl-methyl-4-(beta-D-ribofuranosyl)aminobenzene 5'-phosphate synthase
MNKFRKWITILPITGLVAFAAIVFIRLQIASANVKHDLDALASVVPMEIGETSNLEILPLYEGAASQPDLQSGLGVSYLIKTDTATILLDVGNNPDDVSPSPLQQNMAKLGVSMDQVDMIVISHSHFDHRGGQKWQSQGTFSIAGDTQIPLGDRPIYLPEEMMYPGSSPIIAKTPTKIAEGVATTGSIPYVYPFPAWLAIPQGTEQALAINVKDVGIVLITGCGHMGLDSLVTHAQAYFDEPIAGVVGGLHEGNATAQDLHPEIQLLQTLHPKLIAVSPHDSYAPALTAFEQAFPNAYQSVQVGLSISFP